MLNLAENFNEEDIYKVIKKSFHRLPIISCQGNITITQWRNWITIIPNDQINLTNEEQMHSMYIWL